MDRGAAIAITIVLAVVVCTGGVVLAVFTCGIAVLAVVVVGIATALSAAVEWSARRRRLTKRT